MAFRISDGNFIAQIGELAAGYAIGGATGTALTPLLQSLQNKLWNLDPSLPTDPGTLALLLRLEMIDVATASDEASKSGVGPDSLVRMVESLIAPPAISEILQLVNRGEMTEEAGAAVLILGGSDPRYVGQIMKLRKEILSPADLAMMRQQNFIQRDEHIMRSALAGVDAEEAELLFDISGEPPGAEQMIALWRRGKATEDDVRAAIIEGRIKIKWTDFVLSLKDVPLSPSVAAEAVLRERNLPRDPHYYANAAGLSNEDFDAWVDMMGRPPGPMEALTLINRRVHGDPDGEEARAFFREVIARSDVRTEYADDLYNLRIHYPPLFQVQRALAAGTITPEIATTTLRAEGYPEEWVKAIAQSHPGSGATKAKDIAAGTIEVLYVAGIDNHEAAIAALEHLGYDPQESEQYLAAWNARRIAAELVHGVTLIRSRFTAWKIDEHVARADLADFDVKPDTITRLIKWWTDEREASAPELTHSMVTTGFKYGRYTYDEAIQLLLRFGWSNEDALTLLWNTMHGDPRIATNQSNTGTPVAVTPPPPSVG